MRDLGHVSAQPEDREDHQEDRRGKANLGRASDALETDGPGDERHGGAGGAADQHGVPPQQRR